MSEIPSRYRANPESAEIFYLGRKAPAARANLIMKFCRRTFRARPIPCRTKKIRSARPFNLWSRKTSVSRLFDVKQFVTLPADINHHGIGSDFDAGNMNTAAGSNDITLVTGGKSVIVDNDIPVIHRAGKSFDGQ